MWECKENLHNSVNARDKTEVLITYLLWPCKITKEVLTTSGIRPSGQIHLPKLVRSNWFFFLFLISLMLCISHKMIRTKKALDMFPTMVARFHASAMTSGSSRLWRCFLHTKSRFATLLLAISPSPLMSLPKITDHSITRHQQKEFITIIWHTPRQIQPGYSNVE